MRLTKRGRENEGKMEIEGVMSRWARKSILRGRKVSEAE